MEEDDGQLPVELISCGWLTPVSGLQVNDFDYHLVISAKSFQPNKFRGKYLKALRLSSNLRGLKDLSTTWKLPFKYA